MFIAMRLMNVVAVWGIVFIGLSSGLQAGPFEVFVTNQTSGMVSRFSESGALLDTIDNVSNGLLDPSNITADSMGNFYVTYSINTSSVLKYSPSGELLQTINTGYSPGEARVGPDGNLYVNDYFNGDVYRYSSDGTDLGLFVATDQVRAWYSAFDSDGNYYFSNFWERNIRKISPSGDDLGDLATGLGNGSDLFSVFDIEIGSDGNLYAAIRNENVVRKFSPFRR